MGRDHLIELDVDGKIVLKCMLDKYLNYEVIKKLIF
jgi:hypothetical protein